MILPGLALGVVIGLSLGLLGGGGSILTVPVFVYVLGFGAKEAIAMSLAVVGAVALVGAATHWREGNVNLRVALLFGSVAMVGTYGGARLAAFVSGEVQLVLFAGVMLAAAVFMFRDRTSLADPGAGRTDPLSGPGIFALVTLEGLGVGVLTGLVGVGGGFLIVPALVLLGGVGMKEAIGTSLLVIAMKSTTGLYGYLGQVEVAWAVTAAFSAAAVIGIFAGTRLTRRVPARALRRGFALFLVAMGGLILYQNRSAIPGFEEARAAPVSGSPPASRGAAAPSPTSKESQP